MTPKEKAEELVDKYYITIVSFLNDRMKEANAKKCALIAVDEILNIEPPELSYMELFSKSWWDEVKQEIKKI